MILTLACADFPGHARRVVREPLCPACVTQAMPALPDAAPCARCRGSRVVPKMHCDAPCPACTVDPIDTLQAAGWTPVGRLWRDPADGALRTEAHALRLAGKDAGEVRT
jgi:hypothetical protein